MNQLPELYRMLFGEEMGTPSQTLKKGEDTIRPGGPTDTAHRA
jgi:hypothetical protein